MAKSSRFRPAVILLAPLLIALGTLLPWPSSGSEQAAGDADRAATEASKIVWLEEAEPPADAKGKVGEESEEEQQSPWEQNVDDFFGTYLVGPLDKVLFFDFWTSEWLNVRVLKEVECPECKTKWKVELGDSYSHETVWNEVDGLPKTLTCPKCHAEGKEVQVDIVKGTSVPLVALWLLAGAVFFTLRMKFINIRGFWHGVRLTKGDYDDPSEPGEVTHFQALASALSATVGLGNIAGVAIAVGNGGPGAIFWMILAGLLGMSSKFTECTLGQMYRKIAPDGTVSGGPMQYLREGLKECRIGRFRLTGLGMFLSIVFAVVCMGGSFGGGCTFQVSQSMEALKGQIGFLNQYSWIYGLVMVFLVGIVIIGGIRRIAATAEKIVPLMCGLYVATAIYILAAHYDHIGWAFGQIFSQAFSPDAIYGGFLGVLVIGIKRAAFSNEAGIGSAAIAHAAAKTEIPIREGIVALLEPFIDTVVICTMTGLVIVITGVYNDPNCAEMVAAEKGAALTSVAFGGVVSWFPWILCVAVFLFAYSTMISWSYYGERCWSYLFGSRTAMLYRVIFLCFVMLGSIVTATNIKNFSDLMILSMAFPNILGILFLTGKVRRALDDYWKRYRAGEWDRPKGVNL